ncbi:MAG TPA: hypothetical protein VIL28_04590 [Steroidobacteraceae bacterium]
MSEPNDRSFEEYLKGESAVSARYRELPEDEVPPELDAAVMAKARAAIAQSPPRTSRRVGPSSWVRWSAPFAVAASAVVVVAIVLNAGPEQKMPMQPHFDVPSPLGERRYTEAPPSELAPVAGTPSERIMVPEFEAEELTSSSTAQEADDASRTLSASGEGPSAPTIAQPVPSSPPTPQGADEVQLAKAREAASAARNESERQKRLSADIAARRTAPSASSGQIAAPSASASAAPPLPPEDWLERIRTLRSEGKTSEADEQWRAFVTAYPDFAVSATDAARPATQQ